jgi:uncharacterized protein YqjF (DUF2071 family)
MTPVVNGPNRARPFLTAEWRYLVMLNYAIDPAVLTPLVPGGTELDLWMDRALVSVVGFRFLNTRVLGLPVPLHRDFDEVNLRFYVRHTRPAGQTRRGVVFVREFVPRAAIASLARLAYNEPYSTVPMRSTVPPAPVEAPGRLSYEWQTDEAWHRLAATAIGVPLVPALGSEAAFITEHYWGYTRQRDGATVEYEVTHPVWRVWQAAEPILDADVIGLYGPAFGAALSRPPVSALIAEGSPITVHRPRRFLTRVS